MQAKTFLPIALLLLTGLAATAGADHRSRRSWTSLPYDDACIGGERCGNALELNLDGRPVQAVRFYAHDDVGNRYKGKLNVSIDGYRLASHLDVKRDGAVHQIDARGHSGRYLVFTAASNDEVVIEDVEVLYGGHYDRPYRPSPTGRGPAWQNLPWASGCFGGEICGHYGDSLDVHLSGTAIVGLRVYAHDAVGSRTGGRLRILLDGAVLEPSIDVKRSGSVFELELGGRRGRYLSLQALTHDEVVVERVEVLYGGRGPGRYSRY